MYAQQQINHAFMLLKRKPQLINALVLSGVFPLMAASYSLYHASQSPFCMWSSSPSEPWQAYHNRQQKIYTNVDIYHHRMPVFDHDFNLLE